MNSFNFIVLLIKIFVNKKTDLIFIELMTLKIIKNYF